MPNNKLIPASYKRLISDISALYEGARKALVEAYWKIGQRIVEVEQEGAIKAAYGAGLLTKLSEDLTDKLGSGFSVDNLEKMRRFYLVYPKSAMSRKLDWSHFVELLKIREDKKRSQIERKVIEEELTSKEARQLVQAELVREEVAENLSGNGERETDPPELLVPVRGMLYTYRIIQPKLVGKEDSELLMDLGFSCTKDVEDVTSRGLKPGDIVTSAKDAEGNYKISIASSGAAMLFTYAAEVEKVVDGDTLRVIVDLGFGVKTRQYLRLRGLNCPEMDTQEGKKAAEFVRSRIRVASEIILTSSRSDKYDRYLADIFFMNDKRQEVYLNNALLEQGLAVRVKD